MGSELVGLAGTTDLCTDSAGLITLPADGPAFGMWRLSNTRWEYLSSNLEPLLIMTLTMPNNFELAAHMLFNALQNDPFFSAIVADLPNESSERIERLVPYYLFSLQEGEQLGTTLVLEPDPVGAAIWWFPRDPDLQHKMQQKNISFWGIYLAKVDWHNMRTLLVLCTQRHKMVVPLTGWYLSIAGISPHLQRRGLGEKLLQPTLMEADTARVTCYLETFNPESIPFYNKMRFDQVSSNFEPVTNSLYWIMLREPKKV